MALKEIAILTTKKSWMVPFSKNLASILKNKNYNSRLFFEYTKIPNKYEVIFILSYFKIIKNLKKSTKNFVVHASNLPKGKGWSPLFWQILEGKNKIPIVLFEAIEKVDAGKIYLKDFIQLKGNELHDEIRKILAQKTIDLCLKYLEKHNTIKPKKQVGSSTFYKKRTPIDSQLDINKTIKEQFNLMRIACNKNYPSFFYYKNQKYILKISKD